MGTTLSVVLLIVIVLAAGFLRDGMRTEAVKRWGRTHGFAFVPQPEHDAALDAWPHDAELAVVDDYVLVRVPGLINAGRLDDVLAAAGAARALFTEAAARVAVTL